MTLFPPNLEAAASALLDVCRRQGLTIVTAESCTGGLVAGCLTAVAGSSDVVDRGFVTYTNEAKSELLGVPLTLISQHGAVSEVVARSMAAGALERTRAGLSVSITGIAGPGGATPEKPVGLVHIGAARRDGEVRHQRHVFPGDRTAVRLASVEAALNLMLALADQP